MRLDQRDDKSMISNNPFSINQLKQGLDQSFDNDVDDIENPVIDQKKNKKHKKQKKSYKKRNAH